MKKLTVLLSSLCLLGYPFLVYLGINYINLSALGILLALVFTVRFLFSDQFKIAQFKVLAQLTASIGLILVLSSIILQQQDLLKFYPVAVSLSLFAIFAYSLTTPKSIITHIAEIQNRGSLPKKALLYTRNVTKVWCLFFTINASIAFISCFQSQQFWTLYNGLISYLLIGLLFMAEWVVRQRVQRSS